MCGKAGGANVNTELIDITGTTFRELKTGKIKLAAKLIDTLTIAGLSEPAGKPTEPIDITVDILEEEQEPVAKLIDILQTVTRVSNGTVIGSP